MKINKENVKIGEYFVTINYTIYGIVSCKNSKENEYIIYDELNTYSLTEYNDYFLLILLDD